MHKRIVGLLPVALVIGSAVQAQGMPSLSLSRPAWVAPEPFTGVTDLRELRSGAVLVTDVDDKAVYLLSPRGGEVRTLGRTGSGPAEYSAPTFLIPLPGDSTMLIDRSARRYLIIDPTGRIVATTPFPEEMQPGAEFVRAADPQGRLYFTVGGFARASSGSPMLAVHRWDRSTGRIDSVAAITVANPTPVERNLPGGGKMTIRQLLPFTPQDAWLVAPSGRLALVCARPYRVEWRELNGSITVGSTVAYPPVPVTTADKQRYEKDGPPFQFDYPTSKPAFSDGRVIVDPLDQVWVPRQRPATAASVIWDVFDARGRHLGSLPIAANMRLAAITARFVYVVRTDDDDLQWLEAHAR